MDDGGCIFYFLLSRITHHPKIIVKPTMFHTSGSLHAIVDKGSTLCLSKDFELKLNCPSSSGEEEDQPLRLHQFVCTAFRSELNVAENGAGKLPTRWNVSKISYDMGLTIQFRSLYQERSKSVSSSRNTTRCCFYQRRVLQIGQNCLES